MAEQDKNIYYTYDYDSIQIEVIEQEHQDENKKEKKNFFKGKRFKILLVVVIGVVTLAGVSLWFFLGNKEKEYTCDTIVLTDNFFTVAFLTYDGYGEVYAELNYSMFVEAAEEIFSKRPEAEYDEMYGRKKAELLYNEISVELDNPYNLSNGENVTVRIAVDEEVLDDMGVKIEGRVFTFEVKGLKDVIEFIPFYYLDVYSIKYGDVEGYRVEYPESSMFILEETDFEVTSTYKDGEVIVYVNLTDEALEYLIEQGVDLENIGISFNANTLTHKYVSNYDDFTDSMLADFNESAIEDIKYLYSQYNGLEIDGIEYYGGWITTYQSSHIANTIVNIYEIEIDGQKVYIRYEFSNVITNNDGSSYIVETAGAVKDNKTTIKVNNREYEIIGAETERDLRVKDMLSSTMGYTTYSFEMEIYKSFQ